MSHAPKGRLSSLRAAAVYDAEEVATVRRAATEHADAYAAEKTTTVSNSQPHASHDQACRTWHSLTHSDRVGANCHSPHCGQLFLVHVAKCDRSSIPVSRDMIVANSYLADH